MNQTQFTKELEKLGIFITKEQLSKLDKYYHLLIEWNQKINLTAITEEEQVYLKHFYDSLTLCKVIDLSKESSLCDIGTGAGFPGIVLKIVFPNLKLTLIDALNKRTLFLKEVVNKLQLKNVEVIHQRAEEYALIKREQYDVVTARAVASLNILLEYCLPLVKQNKYFIALKGEENLENSKRALEILCAKVEEVSCFTLPVENSIRTIIKVKKIKQTSLKYPRKYAEIKRKPL